MHNNFYFISWVHIDINESDAAFAYHYVARLYDGVFRAISKGQKAATTWQNLDLNIGGQEFTV